MKRVVFCFLCSSFTLFTISLSHGQWIKSTLPIPESVIIYDIDFESENKGWAVGTEGYILFYDGKSWEVHTTIADNNFSRISFPKEGEGWAITTEGKIYKYDGLDWSLDFSTTGGKNLFTLNFVSPNEGFVSGADGYLAYYNGTKWVEGNIGFDAFTLTSHFFDNRNGWLSSGAGQLYQFQDSVWSSVTIPSTGAFNEMTFTALDNGYGTGFSDDIWRYNGLDWTVDYTSKNDQFTSLFFLDENNGWAGGNGYIANYCDGIWAEKMVDSGWIFDIHFTDPVHGWAMGEDGILLTYQSPYASLTWRPLDLFLNDLQIKSLTSTTDAIFASGNSHDPLNRFSGLFTSTDGINWHEINSGLQAYPRIENIFALDNMLLVSVFDADFIPLLLKSIDGGLTWSSSQSGMVANSATQYTASTKDGVLYASTYTVVNNKSIPRLYKSTDQATSWTELSLTGISESDDALFATISYTGSELIMVYFNYENSSLDIYTSTDGVNWSELASKLTDFLPLDITIGENDTWYLSGINFNTLDGEIFTSDNKGLSWKSLPVDGLNKYNHSLVAIESFNNELFLSGSLETIADGSKLFTSSPKQDQSITFDPLTSVTYGEVSFSLNGSASSGLPVSFESSNTAVATIVDHSVTIHKAGIVTITASQNGNDQFLAANAVEQQLTINKAKLHITAQNIARNYGEINPNFELLYNGFVNSDGPEAIATPPRATTEADETSEAGMYNISIGGGSDDNYSFSYESGSLTIDKAVLEVSVRDAERNVGDQNPTFQMVYDGFKNNEGKDVIDIFPIASTIADISSLPGIYNVSVSGGFDNNYDFLYINGTLTILEQIVAGDFENSNDEIFIYPNPAVSLLTIQIPQYSQKFTNFALTDISGKEVLFGHLTMKTTISLSHLQRGIYLLKLLGNDEPKVLRVLKNNP